MSKLTTSWDSASSWYSKIVGRKGHYYHQKVIVPNALKLLKLDDSSSVLDLGCGQGFFATYVPPKVYYYGVDGSELLIRQAKGYGKNAHFAVANISRPIDLPKRDFTHSVMILSLQNIENINLAIKNSFSHLKKDGKLLLVLNHPCFRIPRQSSWEIDKQNKIQFRRINRYMTPIKIPLSVHPSKEEKSAMMWTFHLPLSGISTALFEAGFVVEKIEEWTSTRESGGSHAKMEDFARKEIPLFMAVLARKDRLF